MSVKEWTNGQWYHINTLDNLLISGWNFQRIMNTQINRLFTTYSWILKRNIQRRVKQKCHKILEISENKSYGGNNFTIFRNKSSVVDIWINSCLIYISGIWSETMKTRQNFILSKLKCKVNC